MPGSRIAYERMDDRQLWKQLLRALAQRTDDPRMYAYTSKQAVQECNHLYSIALELKSRGVQGRMF